MSIKANSKQNKKNSEDVYPYQWSILCHKGRKASGWVIFKFNQETFPRLKTVYFYVSFFLNRVFNCIICFCSISGIFHLMFSFCAMFCSSSLQKRRNVDLIDVSCAGRQVSQKSESSMLVLMSWIFRKQKP